MKTLTEEAIPLTSADGVALRFVRWPVEGARARMLIVHGRGEHGGRYASFAAWLAERGVECFAVDLRGFGRSGQAAGVARGSLRRFEEYLDDIAAALAKTREIAGAGGGPGGGGAAGGGAPLFLVGHSAGGLAAARLLQERRPAGVAGLALSSPFFAMKTPLAGVKRLLVGLFSLVKPDFALPSGGLPNTRDEAVWSAYLADPLRVASSTARWLTEVLAHQRLAVERAGALGVPALVLQGGADTSSDPDVSRVFAERAGAEYREYPGSLHEVFNELPEDRERALRDLAEWLDRRRSAAGGS